MATGSRNCLRRSPQQNSTWPYRWAHSTRPARGIRYDTHVTARLTIATPRMTRTMPIIAATPGELRGDHPGGRQDDGLTARTRILGRALLT
jgi:hypothetical protein